MPATASRTNIVRMHGGMTGRIMEYGVIIFDSDATVEVPTTLNQVESFSAGAIGSGGDANTLSLDETIANGRVAVPATKTVTVDATGSNSNTYTYTIIGY